jgi:hypothetical protein
MLFGFYSSHRFGGTGAIANTVALEDPIGTPEQAIARRVRLFDRESGVLVAQTWSDATGAFQFTNLATARPFFITADDYTGTYNAVIADWIYAS